MPTPVPIICDTREQLPYRFDERASVVRGTLVAGDYSLAGYATKIAVERKSLDDFVSTVIRARGRFERELERLIDYDVARIVVEGTMEDVALHHYRASGIHPNSVFGSAWAIEVDHGVPIIWAGDREHGEAATFGILSRYWHRQQRDDRQAELTFPQETGE